MMKKMIIDNTHSEIGFKVRHLMISTVKGNFNSFSGGVNENGDVDITINVNSINTGNDDRDNHLKSSDFFNSEEYPTINFKSNVNDISSDIISGDLTIKGVTKEVILSSNYNGSGVDPWGNVKHGWEIVGSINRNDFGLTWNVPLEAGGLLVSEDVKLFIDLQMVEDINKN